jgi:hypothetical protein
MSFYLFSVCSFFAVTILMPVNYMVSSCVIVYAPRAELLAEQRSSG